MSKDYLSALKPLVNNMHQWEAYCKMLEYHISLQQKKLEQAVDLVEIHRAQGAISLLRNLKYLRDEVNG